MLDVIPQIKPKWITPESDKTLLRKKITTKEFHQNEKKELNLNMKRMKNKNEYHKI